jgi:uncharacterized membrane protein
VVIEVAQVTLTEPAGLGAAVFWRIGVRSCVKRKALRQFVPICTSYPWADVVLLSGVMMPALLVRTSRLCSRARKLSAEALMVARSASRGGGIQYGRLRMDELS